MLVRFSVQNFGSIKDKQTLSFEADKSKHLEDYYVIETNGLRLLKLGLIYGANASGKTTILKALDFLRTLILYPKPQKTETFYFEPFLFDENTPNENSIFEIEFIQNGVCYLYEIELNKEAIVREELFSYNPKKSNIFKRTTDLLSKFTKIEFGNKIKISKNSKDALENNTLWNNTVLGGYLKTNMDVDVFIDIMNWFSDYLSSMIEPKTELEKMISTKLEKKEISKKIVLEILNKAGLNISNIIFQEEIIEMPNGLVDFIENKKKYRPDDEKEISYKMMSGNKLSTINLKFEHSVSNKQYNLDYKQESQGTKRYYGIAGLLALLITKSAAYSIDELESSLHPDLFIHFLLSFLTNSKKSQIIATTHNREILNNKDIFRNDAIWITDKGNANCATELYSLADFDTKVIRDTTNIYNAYKFGKLGGVPQLSDYYIDIENDEKK